MYDVADCQKVAEARGLLAVVVVEEKCEAELIYTY